MPLKDYEIQTAKDQTIVEEASSESEEEVDEVANDAQVTEKESEISVIAGSIVSGKV